MCVYMYEKPPSAYNRHVRANDVCFILSQDLILYTHTSE